MANVEIHKLEHTLHQNKSLLKKVCDFGYSSRIWASNNQTTKHSTV